MSKINQYNIYKTTNLINGKYYYGVHNSIDENDGYLGSGVLLNKAIKKYGKENFIRKTIKEFSSYKEAFEAEKELITKALIDNQECYNCNVGGKGGSLGGKYSGMFGKHHSEESKTKSSISNSKTCSDGRRKGANNPMFGKKGIDNPNYNRNVSIEERKKLSTAKKGVDHKGTKNPMYGRRGIDNPNFGKKYCKRKINEYISHLF